MLTRHIRVKQVSIVALIFHRAEIDNLGHGDYASKKLKDRDLFQANILSAQMLAQNKPFMAILKLDEDI